MAKPCGVRAVKDAIFLRGTPMNFSAMICSSLARSTTE
jgi:hypothetical protein